jgi:hypothetical protein
MHKMILLVEYNENDRIADALENSSGLHGLVCRRPTGGHRNGVERASRPHTDGCGARGEGRLEALQLSKAAPDTAIIQMIALTGHAQSHSGIREATASRLASKSGVASMRPRSKIVSPSESSRAETRSQSVHGSAVLLFPHGGRDERTSLGIPLEIADDHFTISVL